MRKALAVAWLTVGAIAAMPSPSAAQQEVPRGDAFLRAGQVPRAEAFYYAAVRRRPRDPEARFALGRYLATRGALRVGAVLIEEARRFGGDPARASELLAPIYATLGDFAAVVRLPQLRLPAGELARARWLAGNAPTVGGPDSARVPLLPHTIPSSLGVVRLVVGGDTIHADLDPLVQGIVVDAHHVRSAGVRAFDAAGAAQQPAVLARAVLGPYVLRNVPVTLASLGGEGRARIGLDWLAQWAPTIDAAGSRTLTMRRSGRIPPGAASGGATRVPLLFSIPGANGEDLPGPWLTVPGGIARLDRLEVVRLRTGRVTLDPRRGELLIDR